MSSLNELKNLARAVIYDAEDQMAIDMLKKIVKDGIDCLSDRDFISMCEEFLKLYVDESEPSIPVDYSDKEGYLPIIKWAVENASIDKHAEKILRAILRGSGETAPMEDLLKFGELSVEIYASKTKDH